MKKNILKGIFVCVIVFVSIVNVNLRIERKSDGNLVIANVEALAQGEVTKCPDYNYVPNRYLTAKMQTAQIECTTSGQLNIGGKEVFGSYQRGRTYQVVYEVKNCDGESNGACCDQRQVAVSPV